MNKNILITSAGKRVELLLEFKRELSALYPDNHVYAVDLNPEMAPACHMAYEAWPIVRVTDPAYIDSLLDICRRHHIGLVIPTIDTELLILAKNRDRFAAQGTIVMVSDEDFITTCRDKRLTMQLFERLGIRNPQPRDKHHPEFPMFAKPYDGSLSTNIHTIRSAADLTDEILNDPKLIFMEYIDRRQYKEFTVDMYFGADHRVKSIVPRERIEVRSGEVNKARACKNHIVDYLKERMEEMPGVRGCICLQLFYRESDCDIVGIEINPRYGGGYPLSYYAGANYPTLMISEYLAGQLPEYSSDWHNDTIMLRYDSQIILHPKTI